MASKNTYSEKRRLPKKEMVENTPVEMQAMLI